MFFSRAFIWGTIISSCIAATVPYIAILLDEHEVTLYNAGHAARVMEYQKELAEYPQKKELLRQKREKEGDPNTPRYTSSGMIYPDDFDYFSDFFAPREPTLREPAAHLKEYAPLRALVLALTVSSAALIGRIIYYRWNSICNLAVESTAGWTSKSDLYWLRPIQRILLYALAVIAAWQGHQAYLHYERLTALASSVVFVGAIIIAGLRHRKLPHQRRCNERE